MSARSPYDYGVQCTKVAPLGQMVCTKPISSANIPEGSNDEYVTFTQTPNSGGRTLKIVDVKLQNNRQASTDSCAGSDDVWKKQLNEVKVTYVNHDSTVLI